MGSSPLRVLVLGACCLPLVMPPGWCCWLLKKLDPTTATIRGSGRPVPVRSVGLCCCHTHDPQPQDSRPRQGDREPAKPATPPLEHCPCSDRHTTPPSFSSVEYDAGSFVGVSILPPGIVSPPISGGYEKVSSVARPPTCPLHVRNCVWRC